MTRQESIPYGKDCVCLMEILFISMSILESMNSSVFFNLYSFILFYLDKPTFSLVCMMYIYITVMTLCQYIQNYFLLNYKRLSREVPRAGLFPKGGILADEMGLGMFKEDLIQLKCLS